MAVFPSSGRALARSLGRFPGYLAALTLAVTAVTSGLVLPDQDGRRGDVPAAARSDSPALGSSAGRVSLAVHTPGDAALLEAEAWSALRVPYTMAPAGPADGAGLVALEQPSTGSGPASESVAEVSVASRAALEGAAAAPLAPPAAPAVAPPQTGTAQRWSALGVVIETEGQLLDQYSIANVDAALNVLPPSVVQQLGNRDFGPLYVLVNPEGRTRSGDQPYRGPANFFSTNESTNELVLYPQQSVFTIVHELGHAYNLRNVGAGRYAMVLLDSEMRSFLAAAGWEVASSEAEIRAAVDHMHVRYSYTGSFHWPRLSHDDPLEDFANSFAMYFLDPEGLRQASPERFEWMAATFGGR